MINFKEFINEAREPKPRKIGKVIGGEHYVHRDYESAISDQEGLEKAKKLISPEQRERYNVVKHNKKEGSFSFIHSPNFDTADEPISGDSHRVKPDGSITITKQKKDPQIWHHKWQWVGDDYKGFDVQQSKKRSEHYKPIVDKIKQETDPKIYNRMGTKSYWDREVLPKL